MYELFGNQPGVSFSLNSELSGMIFERWHRFSDLGHWRDSRFSSASGCKIKFV